jgi:hypothetical protein
MLAVVQGHDLARDVGLERGEIVVEIRKSVGLHGDSSMGPEADSAGEAGPAVVLLWP